MKTVKEVPEGSRILRGAEKREFLVRNLSAVSTQELLKRLEFSEGVTDTYRLIVSELQKRGIKAEVPLTE